MVGVTFSESAGEQVTVNFTSQGFPDFTPFLWNEANGGKNTVRIVFSGAGRAADEKAANLAAGFTVTPKGYTWHHNESVGVMQLVRTDVHNAVRHTGGYAIFKMGMRKIYTDAGLPIPAIYQ